MTLAANPDVNVIHRRKDLATCRLICASILAVTSVQASDDCLHADASPRASTTPCRTPDPFGVQKDADVMASVRFLGLDDVRIKLVGCVGSSFSTSITRSLLPREYTITYGADDRIPRIEIDAAVIHEISHAYQLHTKGLSVAELIRAASVERIELGADFVAGMSFARAAKGLARKDYEHSLFLIGGYTRDASDHGWPEDRTNAFRMGYFYRKESSVDDAYSDFQRDLFGEIKAGNESQ